MLDKKSVEIRKKIVQAVKLSRRGHIASAFSIVEILRTLYEDILHVKPKNPSWENRDRFILSKGHGCLALYAVLANRGFFKESELETFCSFDSLLGGHPEYGKIPGVEASTGSLGHGLSIAVGFALAQKIKHGNSKTYVLISDGECNEGSTWEAVLSASKNKLDNLCVLIDCNKMQSYGFTKDISEIEPLRKKWESFNFDVKEVDGHNTGKLKKVIGKVFEKKKKPHAIICHTVKGKGISFMENNASWHHKSKISDEEIEKLYYSLSSRT